MENLINKVLWTKDSYMRIEQFPDKSVDMILTDPPYDFSEEEKLKWHKEFLRLSRGVVIVFSPPENQWVLPAEQYGFWIKPISTKNTSKSYSRFVEMLFFYNTKGSIWMNNRHWSQYTNVFKDLVDESLHPFRKPPSLIERLILNHSNKGDLILDPFAGSFVVAEVCKRLKRNFISFEKEKEHVEEAYEKIFGDIIRQ